METTVLEVVKKIERQAETASPEVRFIERLASTGKKNRGVRQGDVYLIRLPDNWKLGIRLNTKQLVAGNQPGSRHIVEGADLYEATERPDCVTDTAILGPVVKANNRFIVAHPEHAHDSLPAGVYQCVQQRDDRTKKAVLD